MSTTALTLEQYDEIVGSPFTSDSAKQEAFNSLLPEDQKTVRGEASTLGPAAIRTAAAVIEPEEIVATAEIVAPEKLDVVSGRIPGSFDGPLSEAEATYVVNQWVVQDEEVDLSERRTAEEMIEGLREAANIRGTNVSASRFAEIVSTYAPNAPHRKDDTASFTEPNVPPYPPELVPLIQSGVAFHQDDHWFVYRCKKCGNFRKQCCGAIEVDSAVRHDSKTLTAYGRQAIGLDPIAPPKPAPTFEQTITNSPWWDSFRGVAELEGNGTIKMYIENFLPEGTTLICGLPKEGKSFLALSIAKALTSGRPLFGRPGFEVPEVIPVLYLAAESGDGALKLRCEKFGITKDKTKFICRTLSQGPMFGLDDQNIDSLVRAMRPVIILETLIRFNDGSDEDDATENRKLAQAIFRLIALGARAVIGIHHSRKDLNKAKPTKEAAVRGSGDGLAMVDAVWLVMQDERLYQHGKGPNEVDVVGWGRDFTPRQMRLAFTKKNPRELPATVITFAPGITSCIDAGGDLEWIDKREQTRESTQSLKRIIERLVIENPSITRKMLAQKTGRSEWEVRNALKDLGYGRRPGGKKGATHWTKQPEKVDLAKIEVSS